MIRITSLRKGDVVKLVKSTSYENEVRYAVVIDLLNDGTNTFIEMLEYKKNYNNIDVELKVYKGTDDVSIFPTDQSEVEEYFNEMLKRLEKNISDKREELQKMINGLEKAKEFTSGELSKKLTTPAYAEESQPEFDKKLAEKEEQIRKLQEVN